MDLLPSVLMDFQERHQVTEEPPRPPPDGFSWEKKRFRQSSPTYCGRSERAAPTPTSGGPQAGPMVELDEWMDRGEDRHILEGQQHHQKC